VAALVNGRQTLPLDAAAYDRFESSDKLGKLVITL
jgi:hypothetical protein